MNSFREGDKVKILRGKHKGKNGKITEVYGGNLGVLVQSDNPKAIKVYSTKSLGLVRRARQSTEGGRR